MHDETMWTVSVWDGYTTRTFHRKGTYSQVAASCAGYPPGYIWSVS